MEILFKIAGEYYNLFLVHIDDDHFDILRKLPRNYHGVYFYEQLEIPKDGLILSRQYDVIHIINPNDFIFSFDYGPNYGSGEQEFFLEHYYLPLVTLQFCQVKVRPRNTEKEFFVMKRQNIYLGSEARSKLFETNFIYLDGKFCINSGMIRPIEEAREFLAKRKLEK